MPGNPVRIVHLSDLHFGAKDCREVWRSLTNHICDVVRPELVLVTGDLVDTPKQQSFFDVARALDELDARLGRQTGEPKRHVVCAGNHDRHKRGVAKPWRRPKYGFEQSFRAYPVDAHTYKM